MADNEYCYDESLKEFQESCAFHTNVLYSNTQKNALKNFKEDDTRNSNLNKFTNDFCDIKSEISEGRRIDLDEDEENQFDFTNNGKKDPQNKSFNFFYEIQLYGQYDFIFDFKGEMSKEDFMAKTQRLRQLPYHLKYTLFQNEEIKLLRQKEFSFLYFKFDELKEKGNKMYKKGRFRVAIDFYIGAYSILRWIEFKENKNYAKLVREQSPILDDDIIEGKCLKFNCMTNAIEEDSYRFCIINLLMSITYAYMELRHYSSAIECLNECLSYDESVPDVYFRRAQARMYDKNSNFANLKLALEDIGRALKLSTRKIYLEHLEQLKSLIQSKWASERDKLKSFLTDGYNSYLKLGRNVKFMLGEDIQNIFQDTQYKILKEMKLKYKVAVKFYTETKNSEQLTYAYKEIESFIENYKNFKWYYKFTTDYLLLSDLSDLSLDPEIDIALAKTQFKKSEFISFLDRFKYKLADQVFQKGNYNLELIKWAIEKVVNKENQSKKEEIDLSSFLNLGKGKRDPLFDINEDTSSNISLLLWVSLVVLSIALIFTHCYMYMKNPLKFFKGING